jgi:hypothetical protein
MQTCPEFSSDLDNPQRRRLDVDIVQDDQRIFAA